MEAFANFIANLNGYLTDYLLIVLLVGIGIFYSIRTRFVQVRYFGAGMKQVFGKISLRGKGEGGGLSSFQALVTAVAAQVGTGNIVGACGAIIIGGPGAIFWMWVIAFFGMATNYAEAVLAQKSRVVDADGTVHGGPVYYIRMAFKGKFGKVLAALFAIFTTLALGFMGSMVQANSISETVNTAFGIPWWVVGTVLVLIAGAIFLGGVKRIAAVAEKIVPIMAVLYLLGGLVILGFRVQYIPETFGLIFSKAFVPYAVAGGGIGYALKQAISQGAKRGLFSNEAGMGSTPHAHALAHVKHPHEQGITAMIGVFIDTFIVLTITALVVISTLYAGNGPLAGDLVDAGLLGITKTNAAQMAFGKVFTAAGGNIFVAICLFFFAFTTIISWNLFGKLNIEYLFGKRGVVVYSVVSLGFIFLGTFLKNDLVWELTDFFNYLMVIPNVLALALLGALVRGCVLEADAMKKQKKASAAAVNEETDAPAEADAVATTEATAEADATTEAEPAVEATPAAEEQSE